QVLETQRQQHAPHHRSLHRSARAIELAHGQRRRRQLHGRQHRHDRRARQGGPRPGMAGAAGAPGATAGLGRARHRDRRLAERAMTSALAAAGPSAYWYLTRSTGAVALVLLTAAVALGVADVRRLSTPHWPRFVLDSLHRNVSLLAMVFLALHI